VRAANPSASTRIDATATRAAGSSASSSRRAHSSSVRGMRVATCGHMRWDRGHRSPDIIDRRGDRAPSGGMGGLGGALALLPLLGRSRFGWIVIGVVLLLSIGGGLFGGGGGREAAQAPAAGASKTPDAKAQFVGFVLDDAQDTWKAMLGPR